ncbi:PucR family transcriptional regulator [Lachnospiraceae bacterium LCP25S3_G4]
MLTNQILQKSINEMQRITESNVSVWSLEGVCIVTTDAVAKQEEKQILEFIRNTDNNTEDFQITKEIAVFLVKEDWEPKYVLVLHGKLSDAYIIGSLCVSQLENLVIAYKERLDKNNFIQNLLLDNFLLVDMYNKAKRLSIPLEARRIVLLIEPKKEEESIVMETLKGLYATSLKDFITAVDEHNIIFIKTLETTEDYTDIHHIAEIIKDTLSAETMIDVRVAYGTIVQELKDVSQSYKEAAMALDVGRIFYVEKNVVAYNELGIGRLIHQLPTSLCDMFLKEVLAGEAIDKFDDETLVTVYKFFENNLNVSETARQLYIHRNTLAYRLEKIQKMTGLDVRVFEDAMTFKIALMVTSHLRESK